MVEKLRANINLAEMLDIKSPGLIVQKALSIQNVPGLQISEYKALSKKLGKNQRHGVLKSVQKVVIGSSNHEHALERWNTRVGPTVDAMTLDTLMNYVVKYESSRIRFEDDHFAYLDDTICFYYSIEAGVLTIHTFYGRSDLRPSITNIAKMRHFNFNLMKNFYIKDAEQVALELNDDELARQAMPFMPKSIITFTLSDGIEYELLYYLNSDQPNNSFVFFFDNLKLDDRLVYAAPLFNTHTKAMPFAFLNILYRMGFIDLVVQHIHLNVDLFEALQMDCSKKAIRSFKFWISKHINGVRKK